MSTINDIAKMAGVSAATVSHVVNKTRFVSPELVKRVEDAINTLDNPPNFVVKKSKIKVAENINVNNYVVLLASDTQSPIQLRIARHIEKRLKIHGYSLVSVNYSNDKDKLDIYLNLLINSPNALGVIVFSDIEDEEIKRTLSLIRVPVISIEKAMEGINVDIVMSDHMGGAYKATNHLLKSGHENIALICSNKDCNSNIEVTEGYKKALEENGITFNQENVVCDVLTEEELMKNLINLLLGKKPPTAVFSANYSATFSIFKFMDKHNISCPDDLSVIGFSDFDWAPLHNPPITTIVQDISNIAENTVNVLLDSIKEGGSKEKAKKIVIPTKLVVRGSTTGIGRGPFGEKAASADELHLTEENRKQIKAGNYTAAISFHYTGKAWMQLHEQAIKDVFSSLGISLLAVTDAHFNPVMQCKQLESLLTLEPDIIIAIPTDNEKTAETFEKIANSKTKLVLITNVPDGLTVDDYVTCVSVNERSHGRFVGRGLGDYMQKHNKTNIGFIKYGKAFYATNQRDTAAEQIIREEYPNLKIVGSASFDTEDEAYEKTIELFTQHPEIEGVYVSWEGPATKAMAALNNINRTDVAISTADLEYPLALNMAKGGMIKSISAQSPYEQGQAMAMAAANALIGKSVPSFIGVEPIFVTAENLMKSWQKVFKEDPNYQLVEALKSNPNYVEIE
jgi:ribose transport system substrate-binding protein